MPKWDQAEVREAKTNVLFVATVVSTVGDASGSDVTLCVHDVAGVEAADSLFRVERTGATWELAPLVRGGRECPAAGRELRLALREGRSGIRIGDELLQTPEEASTPVWRPPGSTELPPLRGGEALDATVEVLGRADQRLAGFISKWGEHDLRIGLMAIQLADRALHARSPHVAVDAAARAVEIFEREAPEGLLPDARFAHGAASIALGRTSHGLSEMEAALQLRKTVGSGPLFAPGVLMSLAEVHETRANLPASRHDLDAALAQLDELEGLPTASGVPPPIDYARAKFALARVLHRLGDEGPETEALAREAQRIYAKQPPIWRPRASAVEGWLRANARPQ